MTFSFTRRLSPQRNDHAQGSNLIHRITALAQSSADLKVLLRCAVDEIGRALALERAAILLSYEGSTMILAADYCASRIGPVQREKLRQLDTDITPEPGTQGNILEIADARSDPRVRRRLIPAQSRSQDSAIRSILIVPLVVDSETVGTILLYKRSRGRFAKKDVIQAAASILSLAVHHFRSQERARGAADREALTNRLLTAIRNTVGVEEILKVAVEGVGRTLNVTRVVIYKHGDSDSHKDSLFTAQAEYRSNALVPSLLKTELDLEGSPLLARLLSGQVIEVPDTSQADPIVRAMSVRLGVRAMALAPITYNGHTAATIAIEQFDNPRAFSKDEIKLLELVTEQTAVALYQAELYRGAREAARRDALISKIGSAIHGSLDAEAVLRAIVDELGVALSVCRCRMALFPSPLPEMVPVNHEYVADCCAGRTSVLQEIQTINNPFLQSVLAQESPVAVSDPADDPRFAPLRTRLEAGGVKSILTTAIRVDGKPIGILSLHHCDQPHKWTQWEGDLVKSVADQAAVAIRQAELYRDVRESAQRASLANQIVASIRRSLDLNETLQVAVEEVGRALGANRTYFCKLVGNESIILSEHLSDPTLSLSHVRGTAHDYITSHLREKRRTLIIDDLRAFVTAYPDLASTVAVWQAQPLNLSQIVCPIFVNGACWGALSINQTSHVRKWTASEIALVEMVAAQVEVAVSHSNLFQETKQAVEREALISHIIHGVNQSNRSDEILPIVTRELAEHLAADRIAVNRFDEASGLWTTECEYSDGKASKPNRTYRPEEADRFAGLAENDIILCNDATDDPRLDNALRAILQSEGVRSFISARLEYKDGTRLVMSAIMTSSARKWTADETEVIRAAADQVGIALERAELFDMVSHGKFQWEATFDALTDGIFIFDQEGVLRRINEAAAAFEGADMRELIGRRCCTLLQGIEGETCRVAQVIESGRPATFELVPGRLSRPVLVTISPLRNGSRSRHEGRDRSGNNGHNDAPRGAVCIVRDLSELRAAEAIAREQRSFLVKLIEHANDSILAFSPEGRLIWFNEQLIALSGYTRQELEGGDYRLFVAGDQKSLATERFSRALEGQAQTFEMNVPRKSGDTRVMLITYTPIYDGGRVTSVLSIARDVTEERLARERAAQADKLRALGQLAAGVAHNFNNILAAILGHAQLIKRDCADEALIDRMEIIEQAALDGAQTVKRIQAFGSQNESVNEVVDINQLIQDSTTLTRARWCDEAQARGVQYKVELDLEEVPPVRGSGSELREVFVNIILNALDAMPLGGQLKIATETKGGFVHATVTDSGIGMNSEVCDHLFEPFFTTKGVMGTGLGLAVSHSIIERHGGSIDAQSSVGKGTTFTISLPTGETDDRNLTRGPVAARSARVLVVDDNRRVREAVVGMLRMAGHHTDHAASGQEALAKLERDRFDVVLTDLSMPEMDGWAVANEVHRRWPAVKVVLITGNVVEPAIVDRNREFVSEVIFKPIRFDDLSSALSQALSN